MQQRGLAYALREVCVQRAMATRENLPLMRGSQKQAESAAGWRRDLKELLPELLRAHGYCRPEIVKKVLLN